MSFSTIDRLGLGKLETIFAKKGWIFREQCVQDYGIDAHIEIVEDGLPTGRLIAIQVKTGESYFSEIKDNNIIFRPDAKHVSYWLKHSLPVIVVLYNQITDKAYWVAVTDDSVENTKINYKLEIPESNILTERSCQSLIKVFRLNIPSYRLNKLLLDQYWINSINNGDEVYVEFDEWQNKSLSRTNIRIISESENMELNIPQTYCFGANSFDILSKLLPWAEFAMDYKAHKENAMASYETECYITHDKETGITHYSQSFEDWYQEPEEIAPIYEDCEIYVYRVKLSLNDLGKTFLNIIEYLYSDYEFEYNSFSVKELPN